MPSTLLAGARFGRMAAPVLAWLEEFNCLGVARVSVHPAVFVPWSGPVREPTGAGFRGEERVFAARQALSTERV
jgi:hypothetical protein